MVTGTVPMVKPGVVTAGVTPVAATTRLIAGPWLTVATRDVFVVGCVLLNETLTSVLAHASK